MSRIVKILIPFLTGLLVCSCDPKADSYTVVVSLDAFRWDYPDIADTPGLNEIASNGIRCILKPSYPASTFPNHYTIATGLVPDHHGIINGSFWNPDTKRLFSMGDSLTRYDPEYYFGEPIWVTAEKAGVKVTAAEGVAVNVHAGAVPAAGAGVKTVLGNAATHILGELNVPSASQHILGRIGCRHSRCIADICLSVVGYSTPVFRRKSQ